MKRMLLLNFGPHGKNSSGYQLAREVLTAVGLHDTQLTERDFVQTPLPSISRDYALAITTNAAPETDALQCSERLIAELEQHDALCIVTPMHNFTIPASLKLWLDHVIRIHRSFRATPEGKTGLLADRPTIVLVSAGGIYSGEHARQADFLTPYLQYALASIGIRNVHFFPMQGLAAGPEAAALAVEQTRQKLHAQLPTYLNTWIPHLAPAAKN